MKKFIVFGADWCSPCRQTKALLEDSGKQYEFNDISSEPEALAKIKEIMGKEPSSIPQVYVEENGTLTHIGGYSHLKNYLDK